MTGGTSTETTSGLSEGQIVVIGLIGGSVAQNASPMSDGCGGPGFTSGG